MQGTESQLMEFSVLPNTVYDWVTFIYGCWYAQLGYEHTPGGNQTC